jgi:hypothetical protein
MHNENHAAAAQRPEFEGREITIGGTTYVVPALGIGSLKGGLFDRIRATQAADEAPLELIIDVVFAALRRNYPELRMETLDNLPAGEISSLVKAFAAVVELSGFKARVNEGAGGKLLSW